MSTFPNNREHSHFTETKTFDIECQMSLSLTPNVVWLIKQFFLISHRTLRDLPPPLNPVTSLNNRNNCRTKDCIYCKILDTSGKIQNGKRTQNSKHNKICNSSNVIYCIECTRCQKKYVGQTKRKIKDRLRTHIWHKNTDIAYHFNTNEHKGKHDMKVYILDFIYEHPESKRAKSLGNTIEFNWIHQLNTVIQ